MIVAGVGFRRGVTRESLTWALNLTGLAPRITGLATVEAKATDPALVALAKTLKLPIIAVPTPDLATQTTVSRSARVMALFGCGSVAEAAALAVAGPGARLLHIRIATPDGMATAAIAEGADL